MISESYITKVKSRSSVKFIIGIIPRLWVYLIAELKRTIARLKGAKIGKDSLITWKLAFNANNNLIVGSNSIVETDRIDLRGSKVIIRDNVIINKQCEIIRVSHFVDDDNCFTTRFFDDLIIDSYSWIATGTKILPQVTMLENGTITGAFSVITKNTKSNGIYVGNPAILKRTHNTQFRELVTCSLQGGDLIYYLKARYQL